MVVNAGGGVVVVGVVSLTWVVVVASLMLMVGWQSLLWSC